MSILQGKVEERDIMTLEELIGRVAGCHACDLSGTRVRFVPPEGDRRSRIMMIAQAPGEMENLEGRMFCGPSGKIFDELLEEAGVCREQVYLTNLIKCMLPKARRPSRRHLEACGRWLEEEIRLLQPRILIPLGFQALKSLLIRQGVPRPPKKEYRHLFGRYLQAGDLLLYPLRHPTFLLFNPDKREMMSREYAELKKIIAKYGEG